jgi:hypothetical protein
MKKKSERTPLLYDIELGISKSGGFNQQQSHNYDTPHSPHPPNNQYDHRGDRPPVAAARNGFDSLPDEVLLEVFDWLSSSFRDMMALKATDRRWRMVAAGHREFTIEHTKRLTKGRWYHEEVRGRAKREREAKSKQRTEEWHRERQQALLAGRLPIEEATPEQLAVKRRRDRIILTVVAALFLAYALGMCLYLALGS